MDKHQKIVVISATAFIDRHQIAKAVKEAVSASLATEPQFSERGGVTKRGKTKYPNRFAKK